MSWSSYSLFPLKVKAVGSQPSCLVTLSEFQAGTGVRRCLCKIISRMIMGYRFEFLKPESYGDLGPIREIMETKVIQRREVRFQVYKSFVLWIASWN